MDPRPDILPTPHPHRTPFLTPLLKICVAPFKFTLPSLQDPSSGVVVGFIDEYRDMQVRPGNATDFSGFPHSNLAKFLVDAGSVYGRCCCKGTNCSARHPFEMSPVERDNPTGAQPTPFNSFVRWPEPTLSLLVSFATV